MVCAEFCEACRGCAHALVDYFARMRVLETFADHPDLHARHRFTEALGIRLHDRLLLPVIQTVAAGEYFQKLRVVRDVCRDRPNVIHGGFQPRDTGERHEPVGGFHAHGSRPAGRDAYRARLIGTEGHVDLARNDECGATGRGTARRVIRVVRVVHETRAGGRATAVHTQVLAYRFAGDGAACIQHPGHDTRVELRLQAFEERGAIHHRHVGDEHVVLHRHAFTVQRSGCGAWNLRFYVPGPERVLVRLRKMKCA